MKKIIYILMALVLLTSVFASSLSLSRAVTDEEKSLLEKIGEFIGIEPEPIVEVLPNNIIERDGYKIFFGNLTTDAVVTENDIIMQDGIIAFNSEAYNPKFYQGIVKSYSVNYLDVEKESKLITINKNDYNKECYVDNKSICVIKSDYIKEEYYISDEIGYIEFNNCINGQTYKVSKSNDFTDNKQDLNIVVDYYDCVNNKLTVPITSFSSYGYNNATIDMGLITYISFDDGTNNDSISANTPINSDNTFLNSSNGACFGKGGCSNFDGSMEISYNNTVGTFYKTFSGKNRNSTICMLGMATSNSGYRTLYNTGYFATGSYRGEMTYLDTGIYELNMFHNGDSGSFTSQINKNVGTTKVWYCFSQKNSVNITAYVNGTQVYTKGDLAVGDYTIPFKYFTIGNNQVSEAFIGTIDEIVIWNRSLTGGEVTWLWNDGNLRNLTQLTPTGNISTNIYYPINGGVYNTNVTINYTIVNLSAPIDRCWFTNNNGVSNTTLSSCKNISGYYWASGLTFLQLYINDTNGNNGTSNVSFYTNYQLPYIIINQPTNNERFNNNISINYTVSDLLNVNNCWFSNNSGITNNSLNTSGNACSNISGYSQSVGINNYTIWVNNTAGSINSSDVIFYIRNIITNLSGYVGINITGNFYINITPIGFLSNVTCGAFTNDTNKSSCVQSNSTNILCSFNSYFSNAIINYTPYCYDDVLLNSTTYNLSVRYGYLDNLSIRVIDEITLNQFTTQNVTLRIYSNSSDITYYFTNGTFNISNLVFNTYSLRFSATNYTPKVYTIVVNTTTVQTLDAYLTSIFDTGNTIFTVRDKDTTSIIEGATIITYSFLNNSWIATNVQNTDISGKVQINYIPLNNYKFYLSKANYQDYIFYLTPIIYSSYDLVMSKNNQVNFSYTLDGITTIFSPNLFYNNQLNTFNMIWASPNASLLSYGYNISLPNGTSYTQSASNSLGSQLTNTFNITNASVYDTVRIDYYYITTLAGRRNLTLNLPIISNSSDVTLNNTFMSNRNNTYGLGIFERVLICVLIVLFVVGVGTMVGQPIPGLVMGLFVYGYMYWIGFIPIMAIVPTLFAGFFIIVWKSGGY